MLEPRCLDVTAITQSPDIRLSRGFRSHLEEAARFCLDYNGHSDGTTLTVQGSYRHRFGLRWTALPQADWHTYANFQVAVERAAYGIAFILILALTQHRIIRQSAIGTGFGYWLGDRRDLGFQNSARLEVSGIFSGPSRLASRAAKKIAQSKRSDYSELPAYIVIVEFGRPSSRVTRR
jgi:hypothetical protein